MYFYLVFTKAPQIHLREAKDTNCQILTKYLQNTQLTVNKPQKVYTKIDEKKLAVWQLNLTFAPK